MRHRVQPPSKMPFTEDFFNLFDNRDIHGNESDEPDTDSDSDLESNDPETETFCDDVEVVEEDLEELDEVPLSPGARKAKDILEKMDDANIKVCDLLCAALQQAESRFWYDLACC
jgi:hypothetical protein